MIGKSKNNPGSVIILVVIAIVVAIGIIGYMNRDKLFGGEEKTPTPLPASKPQAENTNEKNNLATGILAIDKIINHAKNLTNYSYIEDDVVETEYGGGKLTYYHYSTPRMMKQKAVHHETNTYDVVWWQYDQDYYKIFSSSDGKTGTVNIQSDIMRMPVSSLDELSKVFKFLATSAEVSNKNVEDTRKDEKIDGKVCRLFIVNSRVGESYYWVWEKYGLIMKSIENSNGVKTTRIKHDVKIGGVKDSDIRFAQ